MNEEIIKSQIKSGQFARLYVIYGEEDWLKEYYFRGILRKAVQAFPEFNLQTYDDESFDLRGFEAAVVRPPMMNDWKCIVLRDVDPDALPADDWRALLKLLGKLPTDCIVICRFVTAVYNKKSDRWKALLALAKKTGVESKIDTQPRPVLERLIARQAADCGGTVSPAAADRLVDACGGSMNRISVETEKLCAYAGKRPVTPEDVDALVAKTLDDSVYDLSRALTVRRPDPGKALRILDGLFEQKEEPVKILAAVSGAFCDLYRAKAAASSGAGAAEIQADFDYKRREFRVTNALRDSRSLSLRYLDRCLALLLEADRALKSTRIDGRVVLERLVSELAGLKGGEAEK